MNDKAPVYMTKEEMIRDLNEGLAVLEEMKEQLDVAIKTMKASSNQGHDVTFIVLEDSKRLLKSLETLPLKPTLNKIRKSLKARAKARLEEIG